MRSALTYLALALFLAIIAWRFAVVAGNPEIFPPDDFVEYWAAGKLNARGQNPYDPELLYPLERFEANRKDIDTFGETAKDRAVMMWNPPWTLALAMPLGQLPPRFAQLAWLVLNFLILGFCSVQLWLYYGGRTSRWYVGLALSFFFMPSIYLLTSGQISAWVLLGVTLFLLLERRGHDFLAGACGVLLAIKPHLVYLFWPVLLGYACVNRRGWRMIAGGVTCGLACTAAALAFNPRVLTEYWEALTQRPPEQFMSPTLGTLLRGIDGLQGFLTQFLPLTAGLIIIAWLYHSWRRDGFAWQTAMPALVVASFFTAAYGAWPFDMVLLLPALLYVAAHVDAYPRREDVIVAVAAYAVIVLPQIVLSACAAKSFWWFWVAPLFAFLYAVLIQTVGPPASESRQQ
jgi:hypothetical protein